MTPTAPAHFRRALVAYLFAACAVAALHLWGGLPWNASFLIVLIGSLPYVYIYDKPRAYRVVYTFKVGNILTTLGLITEEEWAAYLQKPASPNPSSGDWLARHSLEAVVLRPEAKAGLVYWPHLQKYSYDIAYSCDLHLPQCGAIFFVSFGEKGYDFGIKVTRQWWEENQTRIEASGLAREIIPASEGPTLILNTLPHQVFWRYKEVYGRKFLKLTNRIVPRYGWSYNKDYPEGNYETRFVKVGVYPLSDVGN